MSNPNNCATCDYMKLNASRDGHCYMFSDEPNEVCMQHTGRNKPLHAFGDALASAISDHPDLRAELIAAGLLTPSA